MSMQIVSQLLPPGGQKRSNVMVLLHARPCSPCCALHPLAATQPPNVTLRPWFRALKYMSAMEYLKMHTSDLKSGWFGKIKVNSRWTSAMAAAGPFGGPVTFSTVKGEVVEDQLLVRPQY
jgi:hypothetical protein